MGVNSASDRTLTSSQITMYANTLTGGIKAASNSNKKAGTRRRLLQTETASTMTAVDVSYISDRYHHSATPNVMLEETGYSCWAMQQHYWCAC